MGFAWFIGRVWPLCIRRRCQICSIHEGTRWKRRWKHRKGVHVRPFFVFCLSLSFLKGSNREDHEPSELEEFRVIRPDTGSHSSVIVPSNTKGAPWCYRKYYDRDRAGTFFKCKICPKYETRQYRKIIDHFKKDPHWITDSDGRHDCSFPGCDATCPDLGTLLDHVERKHRSK